MKKYSLLWHIKKGLLSGYSYMDILTFLIKSRLMKNVKFQNWYMKNQYPKLSESKYFHVRFPLYKLFDKEPVYFKCYDCRWLQFREQKCNLCGHNGVLWKSSQQKKVG